MTPDWTSLMLGTAVVLLGFALRRHQQMGHHQHDAPLRPLGTSERVPVLTWDPADVIHDLPLQVGVGGLRWDGEPFPFTTVGPVAITVADDALVTAQITIAVRLPADVS